MSQLTAYCVQFARASASAYSGTMTRMASPPPRFSDRHWCSLEGTLSSGYHTGSRTGTGCRTVPLRNLSAQGVTLIITVDCGISAVEPVALAEERGMDVIVTDHHQPPAHLPLAHAIVNPWLPECTYPFRDLCGAGLAYKLACALFTSVGIVGDQETAELRAFAALATVADVVPLRSENRAIVVGGIAGTAANRPCRIARSHAGGRRGPSGRQ